MTIFMDAKGEVWDIYNVPDGPAFGEQQAVCISNRNLWAYTLNEPARMPLRKMVVTKPLTLREAGGTQVHTP